MEGLLKRATKPAARAEYEAELTGPPIPPALEYLWGWFHELHRRRGGEMGPGPITHCEVAAWRDLRCRRIAPWEVDVIMDLDDLRRSEPAKKS